MKIAVIFEIEPNPDSKVLAKAIIEKFLQSKGVVQESEEYFGYKEITTVDKLQIQT